MYYWSYLSLYFSSFCTEEGRKEEAEGKGEADGKGKEEAWGSGEAEGKGE